MTTTERDQDLARVEASLASSEKQMTTLNSTATNAESQLGNIPNEFAALKADMDAFAAADPATLSDHEKAQLARWNDYVSEFTAKRAKFQAVVTASA